MPNADGSSPLDAEQLSLPTCLEAPEHKQTQPSQHRISRLPLWRGVITSASCALTTHMRVVRTPCCDENSMYIIPTVHVQIACMAPWLALSGRASRGGKRWARTATLRRSEQRPPEIDPCSAPGTTFRGTKHRPQQTRMVNTPWHAHARWRRAETSARMITVPAGAMARENKHLRRREIAPSNVQTRPPSTVARVGVRAATHASSCLSRWPSPARAGRTGNPGDVQPDRFANSCAPDQTMMGL